MFRYRWQGVVRVLSRAILVETLRDRDRPGCDPTVRARDYAPEYNRRYSGTKPVPCPRVRRSGYVGEGRVDRLERVWRHPVHAREGLATLAAAEAAVQKREENRRVQF